MRQAIINTLNKMSDNRLLSTNDLVAIKRVIERLVNERLGEDAETILRNLHV